MRTTFTYTSCRAHTKIRNPLPISTHTHTHIHTVGSNVHFVKEKEKMARNYPDLFPAPSRPKPSVPNACCSFLTTSWRWATSQMPAWQAQVSFPAVGSVCFWASVLPLHRSLRKIILLILPSLPMPNPPGRFAGRFRANPSRKLIRDKRSSDRNWDAMKRNRAPSFRAKAAYLAAWVGLSCRWIVYFSMCVCAVVKVYPSNTGKATGDGDQDEDVVIEAKVLQWLPSSNKRTSESDRATTTTPEPWLGFWR